ncbi:alpha-1-inhibitor 3-like [Penaeus japonicus]|uniref:alpha-1-inhibitor 3-like n=1 Tax=Penaeus japonicus TaxID=27405 RepID=UPI001C70D675|nr:alpha-1-inhibitor 3-like [Penaeus japonicus]
MCLSVSMGIFSVSALKLGSLALLSFVLSVCNGAYIITTPRQWTPGEENQICVNVPDANAEEGFITLSMTASEYIDGGRRNVTLLPETSFQIPPGRIESCQQVNAPYRSYQNAVLVLTGRVGGADLQETRSIRLWKNSNLTSIQTDKYRYKPGQEVKFRVLTVHGSKALVATDPYPEIWVTTPSNTRIAQWKNVNNSAGLVHLSFQLADETEKGVYSIRMKTSGGRSYSVPFRVEEYVLPRFEVKVTPPNFILATDDRFSIEVSALYTFGQHVKGTLTLQVFNNKEKKCKVFLRKKSEMHGYKKLKIDTSDLRIADCSVYSLYITAIVEEEGTGVKFEASAKVAVSRNAVTFETVHEDEYKKPNLPFTLKLRALLPDKSPAAGVPVEVCAASRCTNMTTADDGLLTIAVSGNANRVFMSTLNCRAGMYPSSFSVNFRDYYSPSRSSLQIQVPEGRLKCKPGQSACYDLPVFFSANNQLRADLTVQIMSRGKVQSWMVEPVEFRPTVLPIDPNSLVGEPVAVEPPMATGMVMVPVSLPPTASPKVKVLIWYTRDDGEVVSDTAELKVDKCLGYSANLSWSAAQAQPGEAITLKLTAEPESICSVGVVDRSTELLNPRPDPLSLDQIFGYLETFQIPQWVNSQVNDFRYCEKKMKAEERKPSEAPGSELLHPPNKRVYYYSDYVDALKMFDDSGLYAITDLILETRPCDEEIRYRWDFREKAMMDRPAMAFDMKGQGMDWFVNQEPRTYFPETWLWDLFVVPPTGVVEHLEAPDTITEWVGKAVCAHPQKGVGLSERASITTFTPFFLDLTLPPSVKRGEVFPVKISVFNYLDQPLPVRVILKESPEYEVIEDDQDVSEEACYLTTTSTTSECDLIPGKADDQDLDRARLNPSQDEQIRRKRDYSSPKESWHKEKREIRQRERKARSRKNRRGEMHATDQEPQIGNQKIACLRSKDKVVHTVWIRPLVLGEVELAVAAFVNSSIPERCRGPGKTDRIDRRDTMIKKIKVEAEGFPREKTWTKYVCAQELAEGKDSLETWQVAPPEKIVADSARGWVTVVGDLLVLSLENLGSLIRMPSGCGEQNMINFAPNIYIMQYLKATNQGTPESTEKLLRFMRTGYQRQLLYRRRDGSYSAFGKKDESGSTWLTAFVLKSFAQAKEFITIDGRALDDMQKWLVKTDVDNRGCLKPVGKVLHKGLQGGLSSDGTQSVGLTAYALISLYESGMGVEEETISNLIRCVVSAPSPPGDDPYTLSMKAYALVLAGEERAEAALEELLGMAVEEKNALYWNMTKGNPSAGNKAPLAVETASYAVLAMMVQNPEKYALRAKKVVKWIVGARNGYGGFYSTQATVMALQALSFYEAMFYQGGLNLVVTVNAKNLSRAFEVNENNRLLEQLMKLPDLPSNVSITMEGRGCAVMQAVLRYNIPEPEASAAFSLAVNAATEKDLADNCIQKHLSLCATYLLPDGSSNMAVIEVNLISGFVPLKEDLETLVGQKDKVIKRYEVEGNKVSLYVDEFLTGKEFCVDFDVVREVEVEDAKPGTVVVYDYYEPEVAVSKSFQFPPIEGC